MGEPITVKRKLFERFCRHVARRLVQVYAPAVEDEDLCDQLSIALRDPGELMIIVQAADEKGREF